MEAGISLEEDMRVMSVVAHMIAQAVKIRQTAMEEHERLREENERLHNRLKDRFQPANIVGKSKAMQEGVRPVGPGFQGPTPPC